MKDIGLLRISRTKVLIFYWRSIVVSRFNHYRYCRLRANLFIGSFTQSSSDFSPNLAIHCSLMHIASHFLKLFYSVGKLMTHQQIFASNIWQHTSIADDALGIFFVDLSRSCPFCRVLCQPGLMEMCICRFRRSYSTDHQLAVNLTAAFFSPVGGSILFWPSRGISCIIWAHITTLI